MDPRTNVFHTVAKTAWEQQVSGILLRCVPGALTAPHIQADLQKVSHSLGMDIAPRILPLLLLAMQKNKTVALQIHDFGTMPMFPHLPEIKGIFSQWKIW